MQGKTGIPHLYNNNGSTQMNIFEFMSLIEKIDTELNGIIKPEDCIISEKLDGSSNFVGYDKKGFFWEKFGTDAILRDNNDWDQYFWLVPYSETIQTIKDNKEFENICHKLSLENNNEGIKVQLEFIINAASKDDDPTLTRIVLVPYKREKLSKLGTVRVVKAITSESLQLIDNQNEICDQIAQILNSEDLEVKTVLNNDFIFDQIDLRDIIDIYKEFKEKTSDLDLEQIYTSRKRSDINIRKNIQEIISKIQEKVQDRIIEKFPNGNYGDYYEGIVIHLLGFTFKITSNKFKDFIKNHKKTINESEIIEVNNPNKFNINVGIGWFNNNCTEIIHEFYNNYLDLLNFPMKAIWNKVSSNEQFKNEFESVISHNDYLIKHKNIIQKFPDFIKSKSFMNSKGSGGLRFGYPRFRVWYSEKYDLLRINLPMEMKNINIENNPLIQHILDKCNYKFVTTKFLYFFDDQFYKFSNYEKFKSEGLVEKEVPNVIKNNSRYVDHGNCIEDTGVEPDSWEDNWQHLY